MKKFDYTITDALGIHARPAGELVKVAKGFSSKITLGCHRKEVDAKRMISVMSLGAKQGALLSVSVEGEDEEAACEALSSFLSGNL